jgi:carbonic anhydrase
MSGMAGGAASRIPRRRTAIVTCMDARIDPLGILGFVLGDVHVIRNAGAAVTDDVLRSLRLSSSAAGTGTVILMGHRDCAAYESDAEAEQALRAGAERLAVRLPSMKLSVAVYDPESGQLEPLDRLGA